MKKTGLFFLFILFNISLSAQTFFDVEPGYGTLNDAIAAHQGDVVYRLQAGGWYLLNGQIENNGFSLTIVGTTPAEGEMPAVIQTATNNDGTVLADMFNVVGDLNIKNVFLVNADANNTLGSGVFNVSSSSPVTVVMDSITCDPIGSNHFIVFNPTAFPKLYVTNSLFLRHGNLNSSNDWCLFDLAGNVGNGYDTLYIENNTFVSTGTHIAIWRNTAGTDSNNFVWFNHNTFLFHKFGLAEAYNMKSYFVTNNLFFDFSTQPYNTSWSAYTPDGMQNKYQAIIHIDTLASDFVNGELNSSRKAFVEYNSWFLDPRIASYVTTWAAEHTQNNDGVTPLEEAYIMQLLYPADSTSVNREANIFNSAGFPYVKTGNFLNQADPLWTDSKIYNIQDSIANWALPAMMLNNWGFLSDNLPVQPSQAGNWWWCDDETDNLGNPDVWPRIDASYTNSAMLTASSETLPLGDLNWFPAQKKIWQDNKAAAMQHILDENETRIALTSVEQADNLIPAKFELSQNYPNPFNPSTQITYSIPKGGMVTLKVFNLLGQEVATLVNQNQNAGNYVVNFNASSLSSGIYMYRIQADNTSLTRKMVVLK
jgi:hypothetical protein